MRQILKGIVEAVLFTALMFSLYMAMVLLCALNDKCYNNHIGDNYGSYYATNSSISG